MTKEVKIMKELVSIVLISYNSKDYIDDCIKSVVNQSYKNLDIVIVNDGSKDESPDIIEEYAKKDQRINFINRKENKGTMYTRREGYENIKGKYVFFIDSDDMLEPNAIEVLYNEMIKNNCDIVKCGNSMLKKEKINTSIPNISTIRIIKKENFEPEFYDLLYKTIVMNTMWGMLIKKEVLKDITKVDTDMIYGEDLTNNLYLYSNIKSIAFIPDNLYIYRCNMNSITNTINENRVFKKLQDAIKTYKIMFDFVDKYRIEDSKRYKAYAADKMRWYVTSSIITLSSVKKYSEIKEMIKNILNDEKVTNICGCANNKFITSKNRLLRIAIELLFNQKYLLFYIYSKYIYTSLKMIKRNIK